MEQFGIELQKYFKFNSSHFVIYKGYREPLHGHNYKVSIKLKSEKLDNSTNYVIDFDDVKPIMTTICNELNHCLLLPGNNQYLKITGLDDGKTEAR
jgi:6-pyruvoyl-tetrahydropterin synthase